MATATATSVHERAKRVKFFPNGDRSVQKNICINKKVIRTWDALLEELTGRLKLHVPARSIRTPVGGTRVSDISGLEDNCEYVVVGNGPFRKAGYKDPMPARRPGMSPRMLMEIRPVAHSNIKAPAKINQLRKNVVTVHAYANGRELQSIRSLAIDEKALKSWRVILDMLTDKLEMDRAVVKIYNKSKGYSLVTSPEELNSEDEYICVGAGTPLKKINYGIKQPVKFNTSKLVKKQELAPIKPRSKRLKPEGRESQSTTTEGSPISTSTKKSTSTRRSTKPKREEDGVFHAKPVKHTPSGGPRLVSDQNDGLFHANERREEAAEVEESKDTRVELPIDQVEAEEVADEDDIDIEDDEDLRIGSGKDLTKKPSDDAEMETPLKSHITPGSLSESIVLENTVLDSASFESDDDDPPTQIKISPLTKQAEHDKKLHMQKNA